MRGCAQHVMNDDEMQHKICTTVNSISVTDRETEATRAKLPLHHIHSP